MQNPLVSLRIRLRLRRTVLPLRARTIGHQSPSAQTSPIILTYLLGSRPTWTGLARKWRLRLPLLGLFRCFLPAWLRFNLPFAVTLNRLRELLCVLVLGMVPYPLQIDGHFRTCPPNGE